MYDAIWTCALTRSLPYLKFSSVHGATRLFVRPSFADYVVDLLLVSIVP